MPSILPITIYENYNVGKFVVYFEEKVNNHFEVNQNAFSYKLNKYIGDTLDNIKVNIDFIVAMSNSKNHIRIEIDLKNVNNFNCYSKKTVFTEILIEKDNKIKEKFTFYDYVYAFNKLNKLLRKLKFDNRRGKFIKNETSYLLLSKLSNNKNLSTTKYEECCVCFETTKIKTGCNHTLCYKCWNNIKSKWDIDLKYEYKNCPLCRKDIEIDIENDNESDDERGDDESGDTESGDAE
jgi:hypothetical protein